MASEAMSRTLNQAPSAADREAMLDALARVALADKPDVILQALEVSCGAIGIGATSEELAEAMRRSRDDEPRACHACLEALAHGDDDSRGIPHTCRQGSQ